MVPSMWYPSSQGERRYIDGCDRDFVVSSSEEPPVPK
jgi:hypothetical protein